MCEQASLTDRKFQSILSLENNRDLPRLPKMRMTSKQFSETDMDSGCSLRLDLKM